MKQLDFNKFLLKTAFSCIACDGNIDKREVLFIKSLHTKKNIFGDIDIEKELNDLLNSIKHDGKKYMRQFFSEISYLNLSEEEELKLIEVAIDTIKADEKVDYNEIKFFKVIRNKLSIADEPILELHPDFEEYLEQDIISESYIDKLQDDFFDTHDSSAFETFKKLDDALIDQFK